MPKSKTRKTDSEVLPPAKITLLGDDADFVARLHALRPKGSIPIKATHPTSRETKVLDVTYMTKTVEAALFKPELASTTDCFVICLKVPAENLQKCLVYLEVMAAWPKEAQRPISFLFIDAHDITQKMIVEAQTTFDKLFPDLLFDLQVRAPIPEIASLASDLQRELEVALATQQAILRPLQFVEPLVCYHLDDLTIPLGDVSNLLGRPYTSKPSSEVRIPFTLMSSSPVGARESARPSVTPQPSTSDASQSASSSATQPPSAVPPIAPVSSLTQASSAVSSTASKDTFEKTFSGLHGMFNQPTPKRAPETASKGSSSLTSVSPVPVSAAISRHSPVARPKPSSVPSQQTSPTPPASLGKKS